MSSLLGLLPDGSMHYWTWVWTSPTLPLSSLFLLRFSTVLHVARGFAVWYIYTYNHYIFLMDRALYHYKMSLSLVTETFALKSLLPNICTATQLFKLTPASCFAWNFLKDFLIWAIFKVFIEFITILFLLSCFGSLALRHMGSWLPDQELNPRFLHWKAKSWPLNWQEVPTWYFDPSSYCQPISNSEFKLSPLGSMQSILFFYF